MNYNMKEKINVLLHRVTVDPLSNDYTTVGGKINCINAYSLAVALDNDEFYFALLDSDVLLCDGILIRLLCKLRIGIDVKRCTGPEFAEYFIREYSGKFLFLGSSENVCKRMIKNLDVITSKEFNYYSPRFTETIDDIIVKECVDAICMTSPDYIFLGLSAPKQEVLAQRLNIILGNSTFVQVGAYFDFAAGTLKRAPNFVSKMGMEWLWRFVLQPKKIGARIWALRSLAFRLVFGRWIV